MTGLLLASHMSLLARRCCRANGLATVAYYEILDNRSITELLNKMQNAEEYGNYDCFDTLAKREVIKCYSRSQKKTVTLKLGDYYYQTRYLNDMTDLFPPAKVCRIRGYHG